MVLSSSLRAAESQTTVLLVFTPSNPDGGVTVDQLLEEAHSMLNATVQVMHISDATHPEVSRSFGFAAHPAFVLVENGLEVWRYTGPVNSAELLFQLGNQITQTFSKRNFRQSV